MKRLLLVFGLWLACASAGAVTINVSVTFTPGAAAAAAAAGTTVPAKVSSLIDAANAAYLASGVEITLQPYYQDSTYPKGMPGDSAPMSEQREWARDSESALQQKYQTESSIAIQISASSATSGAMSGSTVTNSKEAVAALPYGALDGQLELTISKIIAGANQNGYAKRRRLYPDEGGGIYCYHSRESAGSSPAEVVPYLSFYSITGSTYTYTQAPTPQRSCEAWRKLIISQGTNSANAATADVTQSNGNYFCNIKTVNGTPWSTNAIGYYSATGGDTVTCVADNRIDKYSSPSNYTPAVPSFPIGDATHDGVSAMNARQSTVYGWTISNGTLLAKSKEGFLSAIFGK